MNAIFLLKHGAGSRSYVRIVYSDDGYSCFEMRSASVVVLRLV